MSDFEGRVRDALHGVAGEAPSPRGLADGARDRARSRRRTVLALGTAAVAAAIAVPAALSFGGPEAGGPVTRDPSPPVPSSSMSPSEAPPVPQDGRVETWRNLEVRVPGDWGYGELSTWCAAGGSLDDRVVERPGGVVEAIACKAPQSGFGVQFFDPAAYDPAYAAGHVRRIAEHGPFPEGSWVGFQYAGEPATADAAVLVVAPSERVASDVLESARLVDGADGNSCPTRYDADAPADLGGRMSVCRYTADRWLAQSELLSPAETDLALEAVEQAPGTAYAPPCAAPAPPEQVEEVSEFAVLLSGKGRMTVVWQGSVCADQGIVIDARERRLLTEDVVYWALSPGWSGGVDGGVPLPGELRR